ncbi:RCC1 domain-containing protein 1 isoform X2 [Tiliqua scincoides]|uniref:RCC1 domain-containing protein 1 isoform X2 n=1 Tax=Tiliqua scincoides TaxID=71010 RepID=UPI00346240C4
MGGRAGWFQSGFRFGAAELEPEPEPEPLPVGASGPVVTVRPSWSFVATVADGVTLQGAVQGALPLDCLDVLLSETHLLVRRSEAVLEAWEVGSAPGLDGKPVWQQELPRDEADTALPLVPGGYVFPWPPFFAPLPASLRVQKLALGHEHAVLLDAWGALFTWGSSRHGQLGHGDLESLVEPQRVEALHGLPMGEVAAGGWHSACISGTSEQEAAGTVVLIQAFPALLDLPHEAEVSKVSCGSRHTAAVTRAGDLYTWGWGKYGQLGHADTASSDQPKKVHYFMERGLCVVDVVCGPWTTYTCAIQNPPAGGSSSLRPEHSCPMPESPPRGPQGSLGHSQASGAPLAPASNGHCQWNTLP